MGTFIVLMVIILGISWVSMRWLYPRPPNGYPMPKAGESTAPRECDYCHHTLAEWRGIVDGDKFFCNADHQAAHHAGQVYQP